MNDRRRTNGPSGGTSAPVFSGSLHNIPGTSGCEPVRTRPRHALRKIFLKTGVTPSASGSAYLELQSQAEEPNLTKSSLSSLSTSGLKLTCTVHGPRPLPRAAAFTPTIVLTTHVKYAPFATRQRRGYVRDTIERDLAVHLETALRGVIIGDRWPKSAVEVIITILEGEEDELWDDDGGMTQALRPAVAGPWGIMNVLSGCITVASAAIADAGIDCVDMVSGGVAALVRDRNVTKDDMTRPGGHQKTVVLDPAPSENQVILAACVVAYLPSRDQITDIWARGDTQFTREEDLSKQDSSYEELADQAVQAACGAHHVLTAAVQEAAHIRMKSLR